MKIIQRIVRNELLLNIRRRLLLMYLRYRDTPARIAAGRCGFFGNMFMTLNGIHMCEAAGVLPIPFWDSRCLFYDSRYGSNAWDYYFQQPKTFLLNTQYTKAKDWIFLPDAGTPYPLPERTSIRLAYAFCIKHFVRLRADVQYAIDSAHALMFEDRSVVGVHMRLTDAALGFEGRTVPSIEHYVKFIDKLLESHNFSGIFLATDSTDAVTAMRRRYGNRILTLDCIRSNNDVSIHGHYDSGVAGSPYLKGFEVIRDAYLLSKTDFLVRTHSRVTAYSLCLNPGLEFVNVLDDSDVMRIPWLYSSL